MKQTDVQAASYHTFSTFNIMIHTDSLFVWFGSMKVSQKNASFQAGCNFASWPAMESLCLETVDIDCLLSSLDVQWCWRNSSYPPQSLLLPMMGNRLRISKRMYLLPSLIYSRTSADLLTYIRKRLTTNVSVQFLSRNWSTSIVCVIDIENIAGRCNALHYNLKKGVPHELHSFCSPL